jgi:SAM-dependent methyltransferase
MLRWIDRRLSALPAWRKARKNTAFRSALGYEETIWTRKAADEEVRRLVARLRPETLSALEISGEVWREFGFASYQNTEYPEFDIQADALPERFDLVIAEHVFEHLRWPARAARNVVSRMLKPGGHLLIVTPFLYRVHENPIDCTRWTETGMRYFLADCGFPIDEITTGSWGNRQCVEATFRREFRLFNRYLHSLAPDPQYPIAVWALATAPASPVRGPASPSADRAEDAGNSAGGAA